MLTVRCLTVCVVGELVVRVCHWRRRNRVFAQQFVFSVEIEQW